jgi:hypothetical protein
MAGKETTSFWDKFFNFEFMLLPWIIKISMLIWMIACPIVAIAMLTQWENIWTCLAVFILWPIGIRLYAELFMIIFKILENTQKIAKKL